MKFNIPFISVLSAVWLILLALCALIGILIVPVDPAISNNFVIFLISAGKVGISLLVILVWLIGWYKAMDLLSRMQGIALMACTFKDSAYLHRSVGDLKNWIGESAMREAERIRPDMIRR